MLEHRDSAEDARFSERFVLKMERESGKDDGFSVQTKLFILSDMINQGNDSVINKSEYSLIVLSLIEETFTSVDWSELFCLLPLCSLSCPHQWHLRCC